jgi:hypothetical protein
MVWRLSTRISATSSLSSAFRVALVPLVMTWRTWVFSFQLVGGQALGGAGAGAEAVAGAAGVVAVALAAAVGDVAQVALAAAAADDQADQQVVGAVGAALAVVFAASGHDPLQPPRRRLAPCRPPSSR